MTDPAKSSAENQQFAIRFPHMVGHIGTHYGGCYEAHPSCAWRVGWSDGYEAAVREIDRRRTAIKVDAANEYMKERGEHEEDA